MSGDSSASSTVSSVGPIGPTGAGRERSGKAGASRGRAGSARSFVTSDEPEYSQVENNPDRVSRYYGDNASTLEPAEALRKGRRRARYVLRDLIQEFTSLDSLKKCGKVPNSVGGLPLKILSVGTAYWSGFCSCGLIHACPVCAAKIRVVRADEIARIAAEHIRRGGQAWLVTLTARHKDHHELSDLFDAVAQGWRKLTTGGAWLGFPKKGLIGIKAKLGMVGYIRTIEVTYGQVNGFHPHLHVLVLTLDESAEGRALAELHFRKVWERHLVERGYEKPSREIGVTWRKVYTPVEAGEYLAKVQEGGGLGNEMARGDMKNGRTAEGRPKTWAMFELMDFFRETGAAWVIKVWRTYEQATYNRRAFTYSRGLRREYLGNEPEKSDVEIATEDKGGEIWVRLENAAARVIGRNPRLMAGLLDVAEDVHAGRAQFADLVEAFTACHLEGEFADTGCRK